MASEAGAWGPVMLVRDDSPPGGSALTRVIGGDREA
jgi:hypothetical protein